MTEQKYYAGVGSRKTPFEVCKRMRDYAVLLAKLGYVCRSGGARGADEAFRQGTPPQQMMIYLPEALYNNHLDGIVVGDDERLRQLAEQHHPNWGACDARTRQMHTRNVAQILGHTTPPILSDFVLCWTPGACGGGGTGQAIRIARAYGVPVYDLADADNHFEKDWLY